MLIKLIKAIGDEYCDNDYLYEHEKDDDDDDDDDENRESQQTKGGARTTWLRRARKENFEANVPEEFSIAHLFHLFLVPLVSFIY